LLKPDGTRKSRAQHRCIATCPECGAQVSFSRLHQHRCDAARSRAERQRRQEFRATLGHTRLRANLRELELAYLSAPNDTQEQDDAFNAFCDAAGNAMDSTQRREWDSWCLKASQNEIVDEALRVLGMQPSPRTPFAAP